MQSTSKVRCFSGSEYLYQDGRRTVRFLHPQAAPPAKGVRHFTPLLWHEKPFLSNFWALLPTKKPLSPFFPPITLTAGWLKPLLTDTIVNEMSAVGGLLIIGVGLNMIYEKHLSVGNLLPAIFVPLVYYPLLALF